MPKIQLQQRRGRNSLKTVDLGLCLCEAPFDLQDMTAAEWKSSVLEVGRYHARGVPRTDNVS